MCVMCGGCVQACVWVCVHVGGVCEVCVCVSRVGCVYKRACGCACVWAGCVRCVYVCHVCVCVWGGVQACVWVCVRVGGSSTEWPC